MENAIFEQLPQGVAPPTLGSPILADSFQKQGSTFKNSRYFQLYDDQIFYFEKKESRVPLGVAKINFDLRFEVIREKVEKKEGDQFKLGQPKGIKFEKGFGTAYASKEIFSTEESTILQWRDALRNQINQNGFHELFQAHKQIGKGNFASVYLAERLEDEKMFAVKAFSKETAYEDNGREAIINQINLMREINHPNIIRLYEIFETENSLYLIIDLLDGGQLYDQVKSKYQFSVTETRIIMGGLISGLSYMHEKRIMHRDLQPENIIIRSKSSVEVVIVDLGLATNADLKQFMYVRCGTPGYVAPEVVNIKDLKTTYDPICDIYSAGLIYYLLLVGKPAFNGQTYNDILTMNRQAAVKYEEADFKHIPPQAIDLLKKMLDPNPKTRIKGKDAIEHPFFYGDIKTPKVGPKVVQREEEKKTEDDHDDCNAPDDQGPNIMLQNDNYFDLSKKNSLVVNSPALYAQDKLRKQAINQDSCLDFQMSRTPVITGKLESVMDTGHNSPNMVLVNKDGDKRVIKQMPTQSGFGTGSSPNSSEGDQATPGKSPFSQLTSKSNSSHLKTVHLNNLYKQAIEEDVKENTGDKDDQTAQQKDASNIKNNLKNLE